MRDKDNFRQVVPWRNKAEWFDVYQKLYSNHSDDVQWAIAKVEVWRARCPTVSVLGVEATVALIRARFQDQNHLLNEGTSDSKYEIQMTYAMAIVRFVNLVCEVGQSTAHMTSIRSIATRMGLPEWLVNLRHSATHKYSIPSLDMLRMGTSVALEWLKIHYWEKESPNIQDFISDKTVQNKSSAEDQVRNGLRKFQQVQFTVLYGEKTKVTLKRNRTALQAVISNLRTMIKTHSYEFIQVLSESGFLVPSYHHLEALLKTGETSFLGSDSVQLPLSLEKFWAPIFCLFDHNDQLNCLLKHLLEPSNEEDDLENRLSAAWVLHILNAISSVHSSLFLFQPNLNWLDLFNVALKKPSKYSPPLLTVISENTPLSEDIKQALMTLVAIYLGNIKSSVIPKKIDNMFTLQDVVNDFHVGRQKYTSKSGPWKKYTGKTDWQKMPIGCIIQGTKRIKALTDGEEMKDGIDDVKAIGTEQSADVEDMNLEESCGSEDTHAEPSEIKVMDLSSSLLIF